MTYVDMLIYRRNTWRTCMVHMRKRRTRCSSVVEEGGNGVFYLAMHPIHFILRPFLAYLYKIIMKNHMLLLYIK